jgi:hypothetical protein
MGPDVAFLSEMLNSQLAFPLSQEDPAAITSIPGFLQAVRSEPRFAMHLADIHEEAQQLGKDLLSEEYDDGNPGQLVERALDELGQKLAPGPPLDEYGRRAPTIRSLLHDMHHPFVLPFPVASGEATGRISVLLVELEKLANLAPPILQLETSGHETMVARNKKVQWRARLRTRADPSVWAAAAGGR